MKHTLKKLGCAVLSLSPSGDASRAPAANILYRFLSTCQK